MELARANPASGVSVSAPSLKSQNALFSSFWLLGQPLGVGDAAHRAKRCVPFSWEHLERSVAYICYVTVFVFSNNLTFGADSSLESLPPDAIFLSANFHVVHFCPLLERGPDPNTSLSTVAGSAHRGVSPRTPDPRSRRLAWPEAPRARELGPQQRVI